MQDALRIFLVASSVPGRYHHATQTVLYETLRGMAGLGHHLVLQVLVPEQTTLPHETPGRLAELASIAGVKVLEPLGVNGTDAGLEGGVKRLLRTLRRASVTRIEDLYPHVRLRNEIERRMAETESQVAVGVWSTEGLAATHGIRRYPKYAYYGMPEHLAPEARLRHPDLFDIPTQGGYARAKLLLARHLNRRRKKFHFGMMQQMDAISNICSFHADLYTSLGHPQSTYLQNMWPDVLGERWWDLRKCQEGQEGDKIVASVGNVFATGNTFGLHYLGESVLPELRRRLGSNHPVHIHVYGKGKPCSPVASVLDDPWIKLRGWVADIDSELLSSKVFLVMNNAGYYRGAHTRFLHAWALGSCVVAHKANSAGMPEIHHDENALLGETPAEIADLIVRALKDRALRNRIGEGGRRTFEQYFRSDVVVPKLLDAVRRCSESWYAAKRGGQNPDGFGLTDGQHDAVVLKDDRDSMGQKEMVAGQCR